MQFSTFEFILRYLNALNEATVCVLPDVGVVLQAKQRMLRVIEDTLLDAQFGPGGPTDGRLSRGRVFDRETGTDVTNGDCLDVSCNVITMQMISLILFKNTTTGKRHVYATQLKKHVLK